ncbi:MAG: outer membrane beta-barrel protein [Chitinophagales bacterium]
MESKTHIDQLFRRVFESFEFRPSREVWFRIEAELDSKPVAVPVPYARYASMLFLFFALCLISIPKNRNIFTPVSSGNGFNTEKLAFTPASALETENIQTAQDLRKASIQTEVPVERNSSDVPEMEAPAVEMIAAEPIRSTTEDMDFILIPNDIPAYTEQFASAEVQDADVIVPKVKEIQETESLATLERTIGASQPVAMLSYNNISYDYLKDANIETPETDLAENQMNIGGMYLGLDGSYNQTSVLESGNVFKGERPIQSGMKFGVSKGLVLGYNFSNRVGIQTGYYYHSSLGQNYVMSEGGEITQKTLSLTYDQIPVLAKLKVGHVSDFTHQPIVMNYTIGMQYGLLTGYRIPQERRYESTENLFKKDEWSVVLGLDYDIYLQDRMFITLGARGTIGTDISSHIEPLNDYAKRNFTFGLHGSLNYMFR